MSRGLSTGKKQEIRPASLRTLLISQLGLTGLTELIDFRFLRVDVWLDPISNTAGGAATTNLGLLPNAQQSTKVTPRTWLEDVGTPVRHAHCHYIWSHLDANSIIVSDYTNPVYSIDTSVEGLGFTQHVHCLWRSHGGDLVPSYKLHSLLEALE